MEETMSFYTQLLNYERLSADKDSELFNNDFKAYSINGKGKIKSLCLTN
jgi:hypothetical protein